jgi:hypothetical protein
VRTKASKKKYPPMKVEESKPVPVPVKRDSRICFGIAYFKTETDAMLYAEHVKMKGRTYNGGWFDGMPCGRETSRDYVDSEHGQLFAVTE